jgi:hypothetical protein
MKIQDPLSIFHFEGFGNFRFLSPLFKFFYPHGFLNLGDRLRCHTFHLVESGTLGAGVAAGGTLELAQDGFPSSPNSSGETLKRAE